MKNTKTKTLRLMNGAILIMTLMIGFYGFNLVMMGQAQNVSLMEIINSNPLMALDLIAVCGNVFSIFLMIHFKRRVHEGNDGNLLVSYLALALAHGLTKNYIIVFILLYLVYVRYVAVKTTITLKENISTAIPSIAVLSVYVLVFVLNLRIQHVLSL